MVRNDKLQEAILKRFHDDGGSRIVFWYDPEQSFGNTLDELDLSDINIINMDGESALEIKELLELKDPGSRYLLYFPSDEPEHQDNWLLDIQLYSRVFTADKASMYFNDLGLKQVSLKYHLRNRLKFFNNKKRREPLEKIVAPMDDETTIDLKMISVLVNSEFHSVYDIILALADIISKDDISYEAESGIIDEINKYGLSETLTAEIRNNFGYHRDDKFNMTYFLNFIKSLMISGFCENLTENEAKWAKGLILPRGTGISTARSFLSKWRDSQKYCKAYDEFSDFVADLIEIEDKLNDIDYAKLIDVETFKHVDKYIIKNIAAELTKLTSPEQRTDFNNVIKSRISKYWAVKEDSVYNRSYQALTASLNLLELKDRYINGFGFKSADDFIKGYVSDIHKFDYWYRKYHSFEKPPGFKQLNIKIEELYSEWFFNKLGDEWNDIIRKNDLIKKWYLKQIISQHNFFDTYISKYYNSKQNKRVVVIISDAFRYEAASELMHDIRQRSSGFGADLSYMFGVLPSYTALGMASLLPHKTLEYSGTVPDDVLADGVSTKGTANRDKILNKFHGKAFNYNEVVEWNKNEGRENIKDYNVIYVYHNRIDAIGDKASSERDTFEAVGKSIKELEQLIGKFINNWNVNHLIVTADHGFIYRESYPEESDKTGLKIKPDNTVSNKRYVIGYNLPENSDVWHGKTKNTAKTTCDTEFWIPRSANKFHFISGSRFIHGGAMPQEITIPVLNIYSKKSRKDAVKEIKKVGVSTADSFINMRNTIKSFKFIQTDKVDNTHKPRKVKVGIFDEKDLISSTESLYFDSTSEYLDDRVQEVRLSLLGSDFDKSKEYHLIIIDLESEVEVDRSVVKIDLAFQDDFF